MKCEWCNRETNGDYGSGRFCDHICQCKWANKIGKERSIKTCKRKAKERREKELNTEYICQNKKCGKHYLLKDGVSKRFCCRSCANSKEHSEETKKKVSQTLLKRRKTENFKTNFTIRFCKNCGKQLSFTNKSGYCLKCCPVHTNSKPEIKEKHRKIQLEKVKNGTHQGWKTRNIKSYAEIFFEKVLNNEKITYEREKSVGKYFLDFVIDDWLDLEIDGKQHKYKERKDLI